MARQAEVSQTTVSRLPFPEVFGRGNRRCRQYLSRTSSFVHSRDLQCRNIFETIEATAGVGRRTWLVTVWRKKWGTSVSRVAISVRRCLCPSRLCRWPCELDATSVARSTRRCRGGKTMCHTVSSSSGAFVELGRMQSGVGECVNTIYCDDRSTEANTRLKRDHDRIREIVKGYGG